MKVLETSHNTRYTGSVCSQCGSDSLNMLQNVCERLNCVSDRENRVPIQPFEISKDCVTALYVNENVYTFLGSTQLLEFKLFLVVELWNEGRIHFAHNRQWRRVKRMANVNINRALNSTARSCSLFRLCTCGIQMSICRWNIQIWIRSIEHVAEFAENRELHDYYFATYSIYALRAPRPIEIPYRYWQSHSFNFRWIHLFINRKTGNECENSEIYFL